ncbi:MAG: hypothetical protein NTX24_04045 [Candidatus Pacearchaeota archaeon]|nr:hypothetical protein [Candidatus Pacearchaeota archaeon]
MQTIYFAGLLGIGGFAPEEMQRYLRVKEGDCLQRRDTIAVAKEGTLDNIPAFLVRAFFINRGRAFSVVAPYDCTVQKIDIAKGSVTIEALVYL